MRKDFKNLDIYAAFQPANGAENIKGIQQDINQELRMKNEE